MTREEAVARIKDHIEVHGYHEQNAVKILEALDMAIKALEQPEIIYCINCGWWNKEERVCHKFGHNMEDHDFCSLVN